MRELGWVAIRGRHLTHRGWAARVRGYARVVRPEEIRDPIRPGGRSG
jgi:hypothetical protein